MNFHAFMYVTIGRRHELERGMAGKDPALYQRMLDEIADYARTCDQTGWSGIGVPEHHLQVRTPALYAGYYRDPVRTGEVVSADGWYSTGDLSTVDADGDLAVVGRKKDMIIRGGANISAREIEELLFTHPKVAGVACVAMPDPVLAERVCAFVVCEAGERLTFDEMVGFLRDKRIAAWKLPERLEIREAFPMTPSGKVQKYLLRDEIAKLVGAKAPVP